MKTKIMRNYTYEGFGFPITLDKVEMVQIDNDWHPQIDVQKIADEIIAKLAVQEERLTGNQVRFIRSYYSMPLREFGEKVVHESHMAVSKWEKKGDAVTNMNYNTEHELRLYIVETLLSDTRKSKSSFYDIYLKTKRFFNVSCEKSSIMHAHG